MFYRPAHCEQATKQALPESDFELQQSLIPQTGSQYLTSRATTQTYEPSSCTAACDKISNCLFANIYYEKDPDSHNNPVDVIKCNNGQMRGKFMVLVTGNNGKFKIGIQTDHISDTTPGTTRLRLQLALLVILCRPYLLH
jgi:hypothetical protein